MSTEIGRLQAVIAADDRDFRAKMRGADQLGKQTAGSIERSLGGIKLKGPSMSGFLDTAGALSVAAGNVLSSIIGKVSGGMTDAIKTGIDYNRMLETAGVAFETLGMSAAQTQKHLAELQQLGLKTPFNYQDLIKASLTMNAFGFSIQTRVQDLRALTDAAAIAAAGTGDFKGALDGVIMALGQMRAKGKVSAEEMNQLAERGIPAWDILSKKVGKTKEELMKLAEEGRLKGDVSAKLLTEGLGQFAGGAGDRLSATVAGKESNVIDAFQKRAGEDTKGLFDAYSRSLDEAVAKLDEKVGQTATQTMMNKLGQDLDFFSQLLGGKISAKEFGAALPGMFRDSFKDLKGFFTEQGGSLATGLLDGFKGVISGASGSMGETLKGWASKGVEALRQVWDWHSPSGVTERLGRDIIAGFDLGFENGKKAMRVDLKDLAAKFGDQAKEIADAMEKTLGKVGAEKLLQKGIAFGPGFFTSGQADIDAQIKAQAARQSLPPELLFAQILRESRFNPNAASGAGAQGLAQFMPGTAARFGLANPFDPMESIRAQADYMRVLFDKFGKFSNVEDLALAGYNAGENRKSLKAGQVPRIAETEKYIAEITSVADAIRQTDAPYQQIAEAAPKVKEVILQFGELAAPLAAVARGTAIPRGGAPVSSSPALPALSLPSITPLLGDLTKLNAEAATVHKTLPPVPISLKELAQTGPPAAAGLSAVTKASKEQIRALLGTNHTKALQEKLTGDFDNLFQSLAEGEGTFTDKLRSFARSFSLDLLNELQSNIIEGLTGEKSIGSYLGKFIGGFLGSLFGFGHARGGYISGPGGPTSDSIPTWLSNGEYVLKADTVQKIGVRNLDRLNAGMGFAAGGYFRPRMGAAYAGGGLVQPVAAAAAPVVHNIVINVPVTTPSGNVPPRTREQIATETARQLQYVLGRNG